MAISDWIYSTLYSVTIEYIAFVLIDVIAKSLLKDAINEEEKKKIWLCESVMLIILCALFYFVHHMPYILILLTCLTFIYTQCFGRNDFTSFVANLHAHWENHVQHEESMKQLERQKQQQQLLQRQALGMAGLNQSTNAEPINVVSEMGHINYQALNKQNNMQYPPNATVVPGQERPAYSLGSVHHTDYYKNYCPGGKWNNAQIVHTDSFKVSLQGQTENSMPIQNANDKRTLFSNTNLQRRSLYGDESVKSCKSVNSIKSKLMNAIGFNVTTPKPVGLTNNGQNMCFINSVIQCLARSPLLVEYLTADAVKELECTVAESELLSSLAELLDILTIDPIYSDHKVFSAARFRKAASMLNPSLVSPPGELLNQQDAAEFLMWLLATLHTILNKNRQALECDPTAVLWDDKFSSPRLASLKHIYGDLNANRINELKDQCRREIAAANGLENESYAEAIQRLSDLEWLTHKQANDTIIDRLFTGQLVEAYHSVKQGHISVNLQAFNVLPVPIALPRFSTGSVVMLEDCFLHFCNLENLVDDSSLPSDLTQSAQYQQDIVIQISDVNKKRNGSRINLGATPVSRKHYRLGGVDMPSPIFQNVKPSPHHTASVLHSNFVLSPSVGLDSTYKTSTPISDIVLTSQSKLQRRCLLRQLPECLIIQLMRFRYDPVANISTKICTSVNVRLHHFSLKDVILDTVTQRSDLTAPIGGFTYKLYGLCLHLGGNSLSHGHYISYCLDGDKWFRMDDHDVSEVNMEFQLNTEEIRQNAYLLFYKRVNDKTA